MTGNVDLFLNDSRVLAPFLLAQFSNKAEAVSPAVTPSRSGFSTIFVCCLAGEE